MLGLVEGSLGRIVETHHPHDESGDYREGDDDADEAHPGDVGGPDRVGEQTYPDRDQDRDQRQCRSRGLGVNSEPQRDLPALHQIDRETVDDHQEKSADTQEKVRDLPKDLQKHDSLLLQFWSPLKPESWVLRTSNLFYIKLNQFVKYSDITKKKEREIGC